MSKKNRPNKQKLGPQPQAQTEPPVVRMGNVFVQALREGASMLEELGARRQFDQDVGEYLKDKNLVDEFNAWRTARHAPPATTPAKA